MITEADHIQLVWDRGSAGTAQCGCGCGISVGTTGEWTPERLLAAAVESSVMTHFLELADQAGLEVLGYVSAGGTVAAPGETRGLNVVVRPCVSIADEKDAPAVHRFLLAARDASPIVRSLGGVTTVEADVIVLGTRDAG
jgi:organic hydroperoxide reductase OsmC/OhrA